jgi:putative transposase
MSRILRQRRKHSTTRMPTLWSRSYYAGSAGHVSDATISRYIAAQESQSVR